MKSFIAISTTLLLTASLAHAQPPAAARPAASPRPAAAAAAAPQAAGAKSPARQAAEQWAQQRNLPTREITFSPAPDRTVTRLFVPIPAEQWESFVETFGNQPGRIMMKLDAGNHIVPYIKGEGELWSRPNAYPQQYGHHAGVPSAKAIVIDLPKERWEHAVAWHEARKQAGDVLFSQQTGNACMDGVCNIAVAPGPNGQTTARVVTPQDLAGLQVPQRAGKALSTSVTLTDSTGVVTIANHVGVGRSKDGSNITKNLIHAANHNVQVVGVPLPAAGGAQAQMVMVDGRWQQVQQQAGDPAEQFKKMTDEELAGTPPPQGAAAVVRPAK
jgi:hypothetical protein